jgi:hypothetical protein
MSELPSHYQKILDNALGMDDSYRGGVTVAHISSLMERRDSGSIFDEGEAFSGAERDGAAEAFITATASPHIQPSLPKSRLIDAAENVLNKQVRLPQGMEVRDTVSSQLLVWWRDLETEGEAADLLHIAALPEKKQGKFYSVVAGQTAKAVEIVSQATSNPTIWGSWGFGTPEERSLTGRGRGVPTNKHGHLHVIDFTSEVSKDIIDDSLTASERLNHYEPWASFLHELFSEPLARAVRSSIGMDMGVKVAPFSEAIRSPGDNALRTINNGYSVAFDTPQPFTEVFKGLVNTAGVFEAFYKRVTKEHGSYYKYQSHPEAPESAWSNIAEEAMNIGFTDEEAEQFAGFVLGIRPTYSQICTWLADLESLNDKPEDIARLCRKKEQYERINDYLGKSVTENSLGAALVKDTVTVIEDYRPSRSVWPEHATSTYIIDDYEMDNGVIMVKSLKLIPSVDSTKSAPEHVTGRTLKRSIGA